jgi:lambda family phage tail tape measure protein
MNSFLESLINAKKFAKENESTMVGLATSIGVLSASFLIYAQRVAIVSASTAVFNAVAGAIAIAKGGTVAWTIALATLNTTLNLTKVALIGSGIGAFAVALGTITANMYEQMTAKGKERIAILEKEKQAILDNVENTEKYIKSEAKKEEIRKNRAKRLKEIDDEIAKEKELTKASEGTGKPPAPIVADEKYAKFLTQAADAVKDFGRAQEEIFSKRQFDISSVFMTDEMKNYQQDLIAINKSYETAKDRLSSLADAGNITSTDYKKQLQTLNSTYDESIVKAQQMFEKQEQLNGSFTYGATVALAKYGQESRNVAKLTESVVSKSLNSLDDSLFGIITRTTSVSDAFRNMANSIIQDIARIMIRQQVSAPLAQALGSLGSVAMGNFYQGQTGITVDDNGMSLMVGSGKALGGSVNAGTSYLVGEKGAEVFTPSMNGTITPNSKLGGETIINQTINISAGVAQTVRTEIQSMMPRIMEATKSAVAESKLRGGTYGRMMS